MQSGESFRIFCGFWLLTQWGLIGIQTWNQLPLPAIPSRISQKLCFGLRSIRLFGILYLGLEWFLDGSGSILILARMLFGIGLLTGYIHFWKSVEPQIPELFQSDFLRFAQWQEEPDM